MKRFLKRPLWMAIAILFAYNLTTQAQKTGLEVGNIAPNIKMRSPQGDTFELESLRGQMVLIDFWASWCGPCRRENPVVVDAYNQFKDKSFQEGKGFTVYSVSLDKNQAAWRKAIDEDQLSWPYHVSDLAGWNSKAAARYRVNSIPANFLINQDGVIIAKDLRGHALKATLQKLVK